jgi:hypothetical protein
MSDDDQPAPAGSEYERMLLLDDLESLREEMEEVGVSDLEQVRRWLHPSASDRAGGTMAQADTVALRAILQQMEEYSITTQAQLEEEIATLHAELDALGGDATPLAESP